MAGDGADRAEPSWAELTEEVMSGMADWQAAHPHASFAEIEAAVEERLDGLRARLLERAVRTQARTTAAAGPAVCPSCGRTLVGRGAHRRTLTLPGNQAVPLERPYQSCPACGAGLFPPG
jgi:YgiT-type zinc finger domain-containing protein